MKPPKSVRAMPGMFLPYSYRSVGDGQSQENYKYTVFATAQGKAPGPGLSDLLLPSDAGNILNTGSDNVSSPDNNVGVEMSSSYIGKVDKARKYAEEPDRVNIHTFEASFEGNHNTYRVGYHDGDWRCECAFFATRQVCSHTMALQRMLDEMLAGQAEEASV